MKIAVADLKKALNWVEANTNATHVDIKWTDNMVIFTKDKYDAQVEIILSETGMLPKLKKEDFLK